MSQHNEPAIKGWKINPKYLPAVKPEYTSDAIQQTPQTFGSGQINIPPAPIIPTAPAIPGQAQYGTAPAITKPNIPMPTMPKQQQQTVSGDVFNRILPSIKQWESTTGRTVAPGVTRDLALAEFGTAADRAVQNRGLALQEYGIDVQKWAEANRIDLQAQELDLRRWGMNTDALFKGAELELNKWGMNADLAIKQYAQTLQATGMQADEAFRYADLAVKKQLGQSQIDATNQAATNAAIGQVLGLGTFLG